MSKELGQLMQIKKKRELIFSIDINNGGYHGNSCCRGNKLMYFLLIFIGNLSSESCTTTREMMPLLNLLLFRQVFVAVVAIR